ncbi:glycosyltransferase family 90 protein [Xylariaceae sp. FL0016]|nr:glycosyltransferase family 90 protein [Xylariaceae sp. FL0016]
MAQDGGTQLTGICFLASFLLLSHSLQRHSLIDQPRLSSFLLLFVSGALALAASLFSKWLPGADGRFDSDAVIKGSASSLPQRPRRYYIPCIIALIVMRLEIMNKVVHDFQCSSEGVEAFLPLLLAAYKFFSHRATYVESDEPEDMWGSPLEDFKTWLVGSPITLLFGTLLFTYGTFLSGDFTPRSTYFCSTINDRGSFIVLLQWIGILLDTVLLIMCWRVLSWTRTTRSRLRTLGGILLCTSLTAMLLGLTTRIFQQRGVDGNQTSRGIGSLYVFDALGTGFVIAAVAISAALMTCESSPLEPTAIATFVSGISTSIQNVFLIGTYQQTSASQPIVVLSAIAIGFTIFVYASNIRTVIFVRRAFLVILLLCLIGASTTFAALKHKEISRHPVDDLIYKNRVEGDRWLRHATVSTTLKLAVAEYKERHHGRSPPRNFDQWFEFAKRHESVVVDRFDQMEKDIFPFWGMKPTKIREGLEYLRTQPNIGVITIADGTVHHNEPSDASQKQVLDDLVSMISDFVEYLLPMSFAINLGERPRVLVPWDDVHRLRMAGNRSGFQLLSGHRQKRGDSEIAAPDHSSANTMPSLKPYVSEQEFRQLQALACPPGSSTRGGVHWNVRDFCASCTLPHSHHQFIGDWQMSLDPCHQPDIFNLHDFHTTPHRSELYQNLLPLFSRSKTGSFNDILIPMIRPDSGSDYDNTLYTQKHDAVFWQGDVKNIPSITHKSLHGSHRHRLVHLAQNASAIDEVPVLLGIGSGVNSRFRYEDTHVKAASAVMPFKFALVNEEGTCGDANCQFLQHEFGLEKPRDALANRYVMLLDSIDGPAPDLLKTLRSHSVPVISTIFHEWYTERLMPWVHFVPIDLRFHALHSTMSYFVGLRGRGNLNGREQLTEGRKEDAKWIAEEGRKWADKAIRREDMEIYLFRLLLEWGRVTDDDRDNLGFVLKEDKKIQ